MALEEAVLKLVMPTVVFGYVWMAGLTVNSAVGAAYTSTPTAVVVSAHPYAPSDELNFSQIFTGCVHERVGGVHLV